jgi:2-amino-4-hydroxy-6-hydroxymethyldihydropteridine diphosphokinase
VSAVLSLGSNLGDRLAHLRIGLDVVAAQLPVRRVSSVYETAPVGVLDQPPFLNLIAIAGTDDPDAALVAAHTAENTLGRLRSSRWGPRTLDVDVIAVDSLMRADSRLTLPHPQAQRRGFVLVPWYEVEPDAIVPGVGPVRALLAAMDVSDVLSFAASASLGWGNI